jgi:signal transduction histidine kinase
VIRDIADRKRADDERRQWDRKLQEAQKLESIGVLAGGLAHDFNNLLTPILSYADLAAATLDAEAPAAPMMREIDRAARRAADLVSQMLAYAGKGRLVIEPFDLSALVRDMGQLLEALISRKAELQPQLAAGLPAVEGDAGQVRQIIMNLVTNAADSFGDLPGIIRVRTGLCYADRQELRAAQHGEDLPEGPYAFLEVSDTGCGIAPKNLARIFEPFFTTKFAGRGLGLAAVSGIVRGHKGAIHVTSEPGRGTTFRVLFPCTSS